MEFLNSKGRSAIEFAVNAHKSHLRKDGSLYIIHPISVAIVLSKFTDDEDLIISALLHDVLEENYPDSKLGNLIKQKFGENVYNIVLELTEDMSLSWEERKREAVNRLNTMSESALLVKSADILCNIYDTKDVVLADSEELNGKFKCTHEKMYDNYKYRIELIEKRDKNNPMLKELNKALKIYKSAIVTVSVKH